ncbi:glutaminyl-peptide cyclotransferase [Chloroflexota bacterium]
MNRLLAVLALVLGVSMALACGSSGSSPPPAATTNTLLLQTAPAPTGIVATADASTSVPAFAPTPAATRMAGSTDQAADGKPIPVFRYKVVNEYPHDQAAWTQGLVVENGVLYEGTGRYEHSSLRQVDLETGRVLKHLPLPSVYFGEGIAVFGERIYQLTWKSHTGFVYDRDTFELQQVFGYPTQGWGLTDDGQQLIMSDGTETLHYLHPDTLEEMGSVRVFAGDEPLPRLNELEYIDGEVYANVWTTDLIARIDPQSGQVTGWIDLSGILARGEAEGHKVLNGIAYDAESDRLFVTGKFWPTLFEIELVPAD